MLLVEISSPTGDRYKFTYIEMIEEGNAKIEFPLNAFPRFKATPRPLSWLGANDLAQLTRKGRIKMLGLSPKSFLPRTLKYTIKQSWHTELVVSELHSNN